MTFGPTFRFVAGVFVVSILFSVLTFPLVVHLKNGLVRFLFTPYSERRIEREYTMQWSVERPQSDVISPILTDMPKERPIWMTFEGFPRYPIVVDGTKIRALQSGNQGTVKVAFKGYGNRFNSLLNMSITTIAGEEYGYPYVHFCGPKNCPDYPLYTALCDGPCPAKPAGWIRPLLPDQ